jgi:hypothetical protein
MMTKLDDVKIDRPLTLTYTDCSVFGTKASKNAIASCYDQGWEFFQDMILDGWEYGDAVRGAHSIIIGALSAHINITASAVEDAE